MSIKTTVEELREFCVPDAKRNGDKELADHLSAIADELEEYQ